MRGIFIKMRELLNSASPTEQMILRHLLDHPIEAVNKSIHELASSTYASPSTVIRLCRKIGFDGYKDFRLALSSEAALLERSTAEERKGVAKFESLPTLVAEITRRQVVSLEDTLNLIDYGTLKAAVDLICDCRVMVFFGLGSSQLVAQDAYLKFVRSGKHAIAHADWHVQLTQAQNLTEKDLGIVLSYSGQTPEAIKCIHAMKDNNVPIISITRYGPSPVALLGGHVLYVAANEPLFRSGAMSSRMSQLNMIDILYTAYVSRSYDDTIERISATHIPKPQDI